MNSRFIYRIYTSLIFNTVMNHVQFFKGITAVFLSSEPFHLLACQCHPSIVNLLILIYLMDYFFIYTAKENVSDVKAQASFNVTCSDNFYYNKDTQLCRPRCGMWTHLSTHMAITIDVLTIIGDVANIAICAAIFLLFVLQYKRM